MSGNIFMHRERLDVHDRYLGLYHVAVPGLLFCISFFFSGFAYSLYFILSREVGRDGADVESILDDSLRRIPRRTIRLLSWRAIC